MEKGRKGEEYDEGASRSRRAWGHQSNFFLHLHPVRVRKHGLRLTYTWGLGGISFFLFLVLGVNGGLLMFEYVPSVERAYADIVRIQTSIPFGALLRNLHRWAAELTILLAKGIQVDHSFALLEDQPRLTSPQLYAKIADILCALAGETLLTVGQND